MPSLAHHRGAVADPVPALVCRVESRLVALPLGEVAETMRPLPISPLPGLPPFVRGATIVRGQPTPVLDAGLLLGGQALGGASRFVTLRVGGRRVALAVDEVLGVRRLGAQAIAELPPLLGSGETAQALGILDAQLLVLLQAARLVPETVWSALGQEGA
jgi:purine-binding chemotaxis protein CheW